MTLAEIWRTIEGPEFAARVNVASGMRTFLSTAMQQEPVRRLIELLEEPEAPGEVLRRIVRLSRHRIDPRYENPWDSALAIYVWVLNVKGSYLARLAAEAALEAPHCWWAEKIAQQLVSVGMVRSESYTKATEAVSQIVRNAASNDTSLTLPFFASLVAESAKLQFPKVQSQAGPAHSSLFKGEHALDLGLTNVGSGDQISRRRAA